jgi:alpha-L-rhamnosidase
MTASTSRPVVLAPTVEQHRVPLGIGESAPRISFRVEAGPGWVQTAYELEVVVDDRTHLSGVVHCSDSVLVPWPGPRLRSRERALVRARVTGWDADGAPAESGWSPVTALETGLLQPSDWVARAVAPVWRDDPDDDDRRPPILRRSFQLDGEVVAARLYVTAHGLFQVELNGERVGEDDLTPGWTSYGHRLRYLTYDVTRGIRNGENVVGAWLADGWYRGRLGFHGGRRNLYGEDVALMAQLEVRLADGRTVTVSSDDQWRASYGPILSSGLYAGETHDARELPHGWSSPGYDDAGWSGVRVVERDPATLEAPHGPPVRCTEEVSPVKVWTSPSGRRTLLDFGQNLVGRLRITVRGPAGSAVTLRHAEVLQDGELCTRPLRGAAATDRYTLDGDGDETWEPRFTFHGFRYAEIEGWTGDDPADCVVARVLHTDMAPAGDFACSEARVNRLHDNVLWSMRGNFVDVPTDCPQRDERLGWTGDLQVFAATAAFLYDCTGMLRSWLADLDADQRADGTVPWFVPDIPVNDPMWTPIRPGALWGDASVLTPWDLYWASGDRALLEAQFDSARAWVDLVDRRAGENHVWEADFQLGDWLDPAAPPHDPAASTTDPDLVATAYFSWSARTLGRTAEVLGLEAEAAHYTHLADGAAAGFRSRYGRPSGRLASDTQTAYALAICFGLLEPEQEPLAGARLAELVAAAGNRIATGFAGTPLVADALTRTGHLETAYALLLEDSCPSWLYAVAQGATTIWERWDSLLPDGSVNPGSMTSFNHYALGAVAGWLHRVVAGLAPAEPGWRRIRVAPRPGGGMAWARAAHETPYGRAEVSWRLEEGVMHVEILVPTGTSADVDLAGERPRTMGPGRHQVTVSHRG